MLHQKVSGARCRDPNQKLVSDVIILYQKQDGIATRKRERHQNIVFSLRRVESINVSQNIQ